MLPEYYYAVTRDTPLSLGNEFPVKFEFPVLFIRCGIMWHIGTTCWRCCDDYQQKHLSEIRTNHINIFFFKCKQMQL